MIFNRDDLLEKLKVAQFIKILTGAEESSEAEASTAAESEQI